LEVGGRSSRFWTLSLGLLCNVRLCAPSTLAILTGEAAQRDSKGVGEIDCTRRNGKTAHVELDRTFIRGPPDVALCDQPVLRHGA
jgi:hypothetical protein